MFPFTNVIRMQFLLPQEEELGYMISVIKGVLGNLFVNTALIPRYAAIGASVATVFAEVTVCMIQSIAVRKDLPICSCIKDVVPFGVLGRFVFVIVYSMENIIPNRMIFCSTISWSSDICYPVVHNPL